ncbi:uncharacterized protein LOC116802079 [Drosophila sechellia]|uniref:uncharacterized protein LOC116802079 n=1 Tax=Drosophila sechellia TaxID=7238 RepID=UPI0013DDC509|nr:uncharacterized protein LOC116802079 [Drosophila sechellia]
MQPRNKLSKCSTNITPCVQQMCFYGTRRHLLAMQAMSAQKNRNWTEVPGSYIRMPGYDPDATLKSTGAQCLGNVRAVLSLWKIGGRRRSDESRMRSTHSKESELDRSARKLYKNARLRSLPLRKPMRGKTNDPDARPLRVPVPSAWAMSEQYYPSGK